MIKYIGLLLILLSYGVAPNVVFHRYKPILFRPVPRAEDVHAVVPDPDLANIYVKHDNSSASFKITFLGHSLTVVLVRPTFSDGVSPTFQVKLYGDDQKVYSPSQFKIRQYVGRVLNSPESFAKGVVKNYVFTGTIQTASNTFYVEPYHRFFNNSLKYNAFIYEPESPYIGYCRDGECDKLLANTQHRNTSISRNEEDYIYAVATHDVKMPIRSRRQTDDGIKTTGRVCEIVAVADHTYFDFHLKSLANLIEETTEVIAAANREFEMADINGDGEPDQNSIIYAGTEIYQRPTGRWGSGLKDDLSQEELLFAFSRLMKDNAYCLAILFTARDFHPDAGPGLAFTATSNPRGPDGGICSPSAKYGPPISSRARLNTLLVSFIHEGKIVPMSSMVVNLLHQIGHSFGSYHDSMSERSCSPNDEQGDFLMYPELHQEKLPNSRRFSSCSAARMLPVIRNKGWCLIDRSNFPNGTWRDRCGNGVLDDDEVCDCGAATSCEVLDPCCRPPGGINQCTLIPGVMCSPTVDSCCSVHCIYKDAGVACAAKGDPECSSYGICSGSSACVHTSAATGNLQECGDGRGKCVDGLCVSTLCKEKNLEPCQCELPADHRCHVCCKTEGEKCVSASDLGFRTPENHPFLMPVGRPCYNNMGTCNRFGTCEVIVKENITDRVFFGYRRKGVEPESGWFNNNVAYLLIALVLIVALILLIIGLIANGRKARMLAKFREACLESKKRIKDEDEDWDEHFGRTRLDDWTKNRIVRMYALFPHATPEQIVMASQGETEEEAVEMLLNQKIPMRTNFELPWPPRSLVRAP